MESDNSLAPPPPRLLDKGAYWTNGGGGSIGHRVYHTMTTSLRGAPPVTNTLNLHTYYTYCYFYTLLLLATAQCCGTMVPHLTMYEGRVDWSNLRPYRYVWYHNGPMGQ